jgi:hypothetical protein
MLFVLLLVPIIILLLSKWVSLARLWLLVKAVVPAVGLEFILVSYLVVLVTVVSSCTSTLVVILLQSKHKDHQTQNGVQTLRLPNTMYHCPIQRVLQTNKQKRH